MQKQEFIEQFAELVARVKRIERWMDQWPSRDRRVQALIANEVRLNDASSDFHAGFKAGASMAAAMIWTLPTADGSVGQFIQTDGAGNLSFASPVDFQSQIDSLWTSVNNHWTETGNIWTETGNIWTSVNDLWDSHITHTHSE